MYYQSEPINCESFVEYLDKIPWCKQGDLTLVAVHHCTPEIIETMKHHELKVFPGGLKIKLNKSTVHMLETKYREEEPIPLLVVWKGDGLEMSFRTHKSADFPYDTWDNPAAEAYEREAVFIASEELGEKAKSYYQKHLESAKMCPIRIPKL